MKFQLYTSHELENSITLHPPSINFCLNTEEPPANTTTVTSYPLALRAMDRSVTTFSAPPICREVITCRMRMDYCLSAN